MSRMSLSVTGQKDPFSYLRLGGTRLERAERRENVPPCQAYCALVGVPCRFKPIEPLEDQDLKSLINFCVLQYLIYVSQSMNE